MTSGTVGVMNNNNRRRTTTTVKIFNLLSRRPGLRYSSVASAVGIPNNVAAAFLKVMLDNGKLRREGSRGRKGIHGSGFRWFALKSPKSAFRGRRS